MKKVSLNSSHSKRRSKRNSSSKISNRSAELAEVRKENREPAPSPLPMPISKSVPLPPAALEPSLYFRGSNSNTPIGSGQFPVQSHPAVNGLGSYALHSYNQRTDDDLVPSFYEGSSSLIPSNNVQIRQTFSSPPMVTIPKIPLLPFTQPAKTISVQSSNLSAKNPTVSVNQSSEDNPLLENQPWFKMLPQNALNFYADQDLRITSLRREISELKALLPNPANRPKVDVAVQVSRLGEKLKRDIGVNTEAITSDERSATTNNSPAGK